MMLNIQAVLLFTIQLLIVADAAQILGIFPIKAKSHFYFNEAIMKTLADAGHHITLFAPFPTSQEYKNLKIIDSRTNKSKTDGAFSNLNLKKMWLLDYLRLGVDVFEQDCKDLMNLDEFQEILSSEAVVFDVLFIEIIPMYTCYLPIAKQRGTPVIGTSPLRQFLAAENIIGNPYPFAFPFSYIDSPKVMTFYQRLVNCFHHILMKFHFHWDVSPREKPLLEQIDPKFNLLSDVKISLLFSNNHASILPLPLVPNSVEIGGIHLKQPKHLPQDLEKFIVESKDGVILFSLGTISGSEVVDVRLREIFRSAFAEIPHRVIWKFSSPVVNLSSNVLQLDWIPQLDILAHENVKAFISHCGISGTYEAIYTGKPMILMPIIFDQFSNAALLNEMGVGIRVDIETLTKEKLLLAIHEVIRDEKYTKNMAKLSQAFNDRPMTPQESVVYWTEYVLRYNGTDHLVLPSKNMPLYQYLLLDVVLFVTVIALMVLMLSYSLLKIICSLLISKEKKQINEDRKNK